jgi:hypothetical protein
MRKHDWPAMLKEQAVSGQTIAGFCDARGLTRSKFYAERAIQATGDHELKVGRSGHSSVNFSSDGKSSSPNDPVSSSGL